ncbi:MAG TPA: translation initiation factor IF-2 subunit beta [Candidatus Aenigmarchaeota archaeon]|nr:translation initiation factor IF-2 subunit beta [Candidatus Aenigmarchaeota archaeon]
MKKYEEMLKEALQKIPERVLKESRLEIPKVSVVVVGNKTIINNFKEIVDALRRDKKHVAKFLFKELATPGTIEERRLILQTKLQRGIIEKKIEDYVKEFVICKVCGKPDTHLERERRITFLKCEACGAKEPVRNV